MLGLPVAHDGLCLSSLPESPSLLCSDKPSSFAATPTPPNFPEPCDDSTSQEWEPSLYDLQTWRSDLVPLESGSCGGDLLNEAAVFTLCYGPRVGWDTWPDHVFGFRYLDPIRPCPFTAELVQRESPPLWVCYNYSVPSSITEAGLSPAGLSKNEGCTGR